MSLSHTCIRHPQQVTCLVELIEMPFTVVGCADILLVNLERVGFNLRNFDMTIIFKARDVDAQSLRMAELKTAHRLPRPWFPPGHRDDLASQAKLDGHCLSILQPLIPVNTMRVVASFVCLAVHA